MSSTSGATELGPVSSQVPDREGRFGEFGRRYVPETLMYALEELTREYERAVIDPAFQQQLAELQKTFVGRPSPLHFAERLTQHCGGARIYLKREDLNHTGAHKINNTIGQTLLTLRMGKQRVIAETGAGQHGVAAATACARFGLECVVYMGEEDIRRQRLNVFNMRMMGAEVRPVTTGSRTLRDAINEAMRDWMGSVATTHYILGSVVGPHPFPRIVRDFQSIIGREARLQSLDQIGRLPNEVIACVGGGSNSAGMFYPFIEDKQVSLTGVEAGGRGPQPGQHSSTLCYGVKGVLHGTYSYVLQDADGQTMDVHSISAGLDYPGVGPEHSYWKDAGRVNYVSITDQEALDAFQTLAKLEGILPALESSHAVAQALKSAGKRSQDDVVVICLSGRGDKDVYEVARLLGTDVQRGSIISILILSAEAQILSARTRIAATFDALRTRGHMAFMPFVTAGDPDMSATLDAIRKLADSRVDLIEIGFPYSDPIADGPVIQASYTRALGKGLQIADIFAGVRTLSTKEMPPLLAMTAYAIVHRLGVEAFVKQAAEAGFSGLIVPDLPGDEAHDFAQLVQSKGLDSVQLVAPTTPLERAKRILQAASGFVYCISVAGTTGVRNELPPALVKQLAELRTMTDLPLAVGFGISGPDQVDALRKSADGVIVGSAIVRRFEEMSDSSQPSNRAGVLDEIGRFAAGMVSATHRA